MYSTLLTVQNVYFFYKKILLKRICFAIDLILILIMIHYSAQHRITIHWSKEVHKVQSEMAIEWDGNLEKMPIKVKVSRVRSNLIGIALDILGRREGKEHYILHMTLLSQFDP